MKRYRVGRARHIDGSESGPSLIWEDVRDDGNGAQLVAKTISESLAVELVRRANAFDELLAFAAIFLNSAHFMERERAAELLAKYGRTE